LLVSRGLDRLRAVPVRHRVALGVIAAYLVVMGLAFGSRLDQLVFCGPMLLLGLYSDRTRRVFSGVFPFLAFGITYELTHFTRPLVERLRLTVHVLEPYLLDRALFGISTAEGQLTPNEFLARHTSAVLDLVNGVGYALFLWWSVAVALVLAIRDDPRHRQMLRRFGWSFFFMNLAGIATYYVYPAAPPWYVSQYGFGPVRYDIKPGIADLQRFDALVGIPYFSTFYSRSADTFGAIPSLHVSYPLLTFLFGRELRKPWLDVASLALFVVISFGAVYLQHHYVIDVLLGAAYAIAAYAASRPWKRFPRPERAQSPAGKSPSPGTSRQTTPPCHRSP